MGSFKKKPVLVEAHRWDGTKDGANWIICWILSHGGDAMLVNVEGLTNSIGIETLEGEMMAIEGDWIVRGTRGEFYPVKPGPFEDTFEEVEHDDA